MNYIEARYDYGSWFVEFQGKNRRGQCLHDWLIVAAVKALWRYFISNYPSTEQK